MNGEFINGDFLCPTECQISILENIFAKYLLSLKNLYAKTITCEKVMEHLGK